MSEPQVVPSPAATAEMLASRIRSRTARVGIVGLGYVGLPLAVEFARAGFSVTVLPNGQVLVAGGSQMTRHSGAVILSSAELYTP